MGEVNMNNKLKGCMMHQRDNWKTPESLYIQFIMDGWHDPCPTNPKEDGLKTNWKNKNFVNPPYSQIDKWVEKALDEAEQGHTTLLLVPARTDTKWFHKLIKFGCGFAFVKGRLHFDDAKNGAPFPSVFILIDKDREKWQESRITTW